VIIVPFIQQIVRSVALASSLATEKAGIYVLLSRQPDSGNCNQRYPTLTQHTRQPRAAVWRQACQAGAGSGRWLPA
jgi:hypothetical protein